ncbi:UDP-N-acetylmuramoyl-L-alanyl-D-glutamate--2,6-diaminopimelate ligase [Halonatronum saccharophilum]|uniref:UDP-N-acetylmuramoyl-L-alanyl-D-glutamate--2, 6-diaminopimelate ligase n=1 Tax=Halonatronum saccharophilum TaxID=150060 RepID=UPI00047FCCC6|nr:UDP-N-acetylmuramoyl-L-alanyl-D-glutamate--2,6-diaminopimelate ligase [Halonatronum saccharophilum]
MWINPSLDQKSFYLSELLDTLETKKIINFHDFEIYNISNNSKEVREGSIFVAIKGFKTDGHKYIVEAIKRGATVIIGEEEIEVPKNITYIIVDDSRKALAQLALEFYDNPSQALRMIGVTGTVGKTTITAMVDAIINNIVGKTGLIGTLHTKIGDKYYFDPQKCTTPNSLLLNETLRLMKKEKIDYVSMEVSSHALKLDRVLGIDFDIAIFTNLSYDHMEFHKTIDDYYSSKEKLFVNLREDKYGVINIDSDYANSIIENTSATIYTYGINKDSDISAKNIVANKSGIEFDLVINNKILTNFTKIIEPNSIRIKLPLLGIHNIYNSLASILATLLLGFSLEDIKGGLEKFKGIKRRMELVYDGEFTVIDDFAHNPVGLEANFKTIKDFDYNNLYIVHFLKGQRGIEANKINADIIGDWADKLRIKELITTKCEDQVIEKNRVLAKEEESFLNTIMEKEIKTQSYTMLEPAIKETLSKVKKDDLLLLLGGPGLDKGADIVKEHIIGNR